MTYLIVCLLVIVVATCVVLVALGTIGLGLAILVQLLFGVLSLALVFKDVIR